MAAETNIKSNHITNLDATPMVLNTSGQGAVGNPRELDDYAAVAATPIQSAGSYYRMLRIPSSAKLKVLTLSTNKALDSGTPTLAFDIGLAWSDSTIDGTLPALQGLIPTTANDGSTTTTFAAYSSPNKIFGGITAAQLTNSAAYNSGNLLFNGLTSGYTMAKLASQPLWQIFGYVDGRGYAMDPGGFFDVYVYATTGANVGVAGNLWMRASWIW